MEEVYEAQRRRLASDWQWLEQHQAHSQSALRAREAELDKSRRLLQCERDEEMAAVSSLRLQFLALIYNITYEVITHIIS